ncbi:MAG TPA: hypothetical protein VK837_08585 [Longimicrobiales bacterium]|nr:hypothetical protein [Longimicrobiales bacterium]
MNRIAEFGRMVGLACLAAACSTAEASTVIPAETSLAVAIGPRLSSNVHAPGSTFTGVLAEPLSADGQVILPVGTPVVGEVTSASEDPPTIGVRLVSIDIGGAPYEVHTEPVVMNAMKRSEMVDKGRKIGGGAAAGAIVGGIIGGDVKGAVIGAGAGAAAGTGVALATKEHEAYLSAGTIVRVVLDEALVVAPRPVTDEE